MSVQQLACHNIANSIGFFMATNFLRFKNIRRMVMRFCIASAFLNIVASGRIAYADSVAFLYALESDLDALKDSASSGARSIRSGGTNIQEFHVGPHKVRAAKMGANNIETAINTANLLARFPADIAISVGPCGALDSSLKLGTWHQVSKVTAYQRGTAGPTGWVAGKDATLEVASIGEPRGATQTGGSSLPLVALASGDTFVANTAERERIQTSTGALAVDMNSVGLVSACRMMRTPLVIWKVVSDRADSSAGDDFKTFIRTYDGKGGRMVGELLLAMPASPLAPESYDHIRELIK
jgi:nucleoside phosphorylase